MNKTLASLCTAATLVAASGIAFGQGTRPDEAAAKSTRVAAIAQPARLVDVSFPGGSVTEYVTALRKITAPNPVNIVVSNDAAAHQLAEISLKRVPLDMAVQAIAAAAGDVDGGGSWQIAPMRPFTNLDEPGEPAYQVDYRRAQRQTPRATTQDALLHVFSLSPTTDAVPGDPAGASITVTPEVVLSAVQAAMDLAKVDNDPMPELKYHKDSGLLVVRAGYRQMEAVENVVSMIERDVRSRRDAARMSGRSPEDRADLQAEVSKAKVVLDQRRAEAAAREKAFVRAEQLAEAGQVSEGERDVARREFIGAQADAQLAEIELQRAAQRLAAAEPVTGTPPTPPANQPRRGTTYRLNDWKPEAFMSLVGAVRQTAEGVGATVSTPTTDDGGKPAQTMIVHGDEAAQKVIETLVREVARARGLDSGLPKPAAR